MVWRLHAAVNNASPTGYVALTPDEANITGALDWALAHGDDRAAARICDGIRGFWRDTGRTRAGLHYLPLGAAAAGRVADQTGETRGSPDVRRISLAILVTSCKTLDGWMKRKSSSLRTSTCAAPSKTGKAKACASPAWARSRCNAGGWRRRRATSRRAWPCCREVSDRRGEGAVLSSLGQIALRRGRLEEAEGYFAQSLAIRREVSDRQGEGVVLSSLGQIALRRGRLEEAEGYFAQSLAIDREVSDRQGEGVDLSSLGQIALQRGRLEEAEGYFAQSLAICREVSDRQGEGVVLSSLGQIALQRGRLEEAEGYFAQSLAIRREVSDRQGEGVVLLYARTACRGAREISPWPRRDIGKGWRLLQRGAGWRTDRDDAATPRRVPAPV